MKYIKFSVKVSVENETQNKLVNKCEKIYGWELKLK